MSWEASGRSNGLWKIPVQSSTSFPTQRMGQELLVKDAKAIFLEKATRTQFLKRSGVPGSEHAGNKAFHETTKRGKRLGRRNSRESTKSPVEECEREETSGGVLPRQKARMGKRGETGKIRQG